MEHNTIKEMRQILDAIEQGKAIQFTYGGCTSWFDADKFVDPCTPDFMHNKYRIKPEKKWRPFKNTAELFAHNNGRDILWLTEQSNSEKRLVTSYGSDYVRFLTCRYNMEELLNDFTFADGTRCGVEEDA